MERVNKLKEIARKQCYELRDARALNDLLNCRIKKVTMQVNQRQEEIHLLEGRLEGLDKESSGTTQLCRQLTQKESGLNVLQARVSELKNSLVGVEELRAQLNQKDDQINLLQGRVNELERDLFEKRNKSKQNIETQQALKFKIQYLEGLIWDLSDHQRNAGPAIEQAAVETAVTWGRSQESALLSLDMPALAEELLDSPKLETDQLSVVFSDPSLPQLSLYSPVGSHSSKRGRFDISSEGFSDEEQPKKKQPKVTCTVLQLMLQLVFVETGKKNTNKAKVSSASPPEATKDVNSAKMATRWSTRLAAERQEQTVTRPQATTKLLAKLNPKCYLCGELWKNGKVLKDHLEADHGYRNDDEVYGWCHCGTGFKTVTAVKNHQLSFDH